VYCGNNPVIHVDPDGRIFDTILDIAFVAYDVYDIAKSVVKGEGVSATQGLALGADVACAILPFATGGGAAVRGASAAEHAIAEAEEIDKVADAVRSLEKVEDGAKATGRLGGQEHRAKVAEEAKRLVNDGYEIRGGGGQRKEEYLAGSSKGTTKGGNYVDITATKEGKTIRVQVGKQTKSGQPVARERNNLEKIKEKRPGDEVRFVPYNK
jgi:hypothetical protein